MSDTTIEKDPNKPVIPVMEREKLILNNRSYNWITERICGILENRQPAIWWMLFIPSVIIAVVGVGGGLFYLVSTGVGVWGNSNRAMWGWPIVNFVFWIGIGHAGTLISAILFLTRQNWRTSINRAAEAMTIFAVVCAGIYPMFHVGRLWMVWFLAPIPNANAIWQNFKSPLLWDVFAVSTYFTISLIFWYLGMVPDLATIRDRAKPGIRKLLYGIFSLGWRGGNRQWSHYEVAYLLLAALSTPLVLSVHSVVSFDFATSVVPGWHTTIFPPYFVAGAVFGGFAMVLTIMIPARYIYGLHDLITMKHIENMAKIILLTGTIVGYAYLMDRPEMHFTGGWGGIHSEIMPGPEELPELAAAVVGKVEYRSDFEVDESSRSGLQRSPPGKCGWNELFEQVAIAWHAHSPRPCEAWLRGFSEDAQAIARIRIANSKE